MFGRDIKQSHPMHEKCQFDAFWWCTIPYSATRHFITVLIYNFRNFKELWKVVNLNFGELKYISVVFNIQKYYMFTPWKKWLDGLSIQNSAIKYTKIEIKSLSLAVNISYKSEFIKNLELFRTSRTSYIAPRFV